VSRNTESSPIKNSESFQDYVVGVKGLESKGVQAKVSRNTESTIVINKDSQDTTACIKISIHMDLFIFIDVYLHIFTS
jgi:hypothetical protein